MSVTDSTSGIWDVPWRLNGYLKLENKLVYGRYHNERLYLSMTVSPQGVPVGLKDRELQQEPVLRFSNKGYLEGLAGLYYFRSKQDEWVDTRNVGGRNTFDDRNSVRVLSTEAIHSPNER